MSEAQDGTDSVLIGSLVSVTGSVLEREADRFLVQFDRGGEIVREWFLAEELAPLGFDDGDGI